MSKHHKPVKILVAAIRHFARRIAASLAIRTARPLNCLSYNVYKRLTLPLVPLPETYGFDVSRDVELIFDSPVCRLVSKKPRPRFQNPRNTASQRRLRNAAKMDHFSQKPVGLWQMRAHGNIESPRPVTRG